MLFSSRTSLQSQFAVGLAERLASEGVSIHEMSRVKSVPTQMAPHSVLTDAGRVDAPKVIVATHLPILDRSQHFGECPHSNGPLCLAGM